MMLIPQDDLDDKNVHKHGRDIVLTANDAQCMSVVLCLHTGAIVRMNIKDIDPSMAFLHVHLVDVDVNHDANDERSNAHRIAQEAAAGRAYALYGIRSKGVKSLVAFGCFNGHVKLRHARTNDILWDIQVRHGDILYLRMSRPCNINDVEHVRVNYYIGLCANGSCK
jgi:hypothetical protein